MKEQHRNQIEALMHSANNCRQMLAAVDRKLARALVCLRESDYKTCEHLLSELTDALPQAMAIIATDNDNEADDDGKRRSSQA